MFVIITIISARAIMMLMTISARMAIATVFVQVYSPS